MKTKIDITKKTVWLAFGALILLAGLSWWLSTLHLGPWGIPLALLIAALKVGVVALVFMELGEHGVGEHGGGVRVAAFTAPAFVALMLLAMLADVWLR